MYFVLVTDPGVKELVVLRGLTELDSGGTKVTDAGPNELAKFKGLTSLGLSFAPVTAPGVAQLRRALAACAIRGQ